MDIKFGMAKVATTILLQLAVTRYTTIQKKVWLAVSGMGLVEEVVFDLLFGELSFHDGLEQYRSNATCKLQGSVHVCPPLPLPSLFEELFKEQVYNHLQQLNWIRHNTLPNGY